MPVGGWYGVPYAFGGKLCQLVGGMVWPTQLGGNYASWWVVWCALRSWGETMPVGRWYGVSYAVGGKLCQLVGGKVCPTHERI